MSYDNDTKTSFVKVEETSSLKKHDAHDLSLTLHADIVNDLVRSWLKEWWYCCW